MNGCDLPHHFGIDLLVFVADEIADADDFLPFLVRATARSTVRSM
jgi:hypothetical protein